MWKYWSLRTLYLHMPLAWWLQKRCMFKSDCRLSHEWDYWIIKTTVGTEKIQNGSIWNNFKTNHNVNYFDIFSLVNTATPYNANAMVVYQDYWNWLIWIELLAFCAQIWNHLHIFIEHLSVTNCKHRGFEFLKWYSDGEIMAFCTGIVVWDGRILKLG